MTKSMSKSVAAYAKANCANWTADGGCHDNESVTFTDDGMPRIGTGQCRLAEGRSCDYFRTAILSAGDCPQRIRQEYARIDQQAQVKDRRRCPECGAELPPRRRLCKKCAQKHRRDSYRKKRQKERMSAPQLRAI